MLATVGMSSSLMVDGGVLLALSTAKDLVAQGHYVYVVFPHDCDTTQLPKIDGVMYLCSNLDSRVYDAQMWLVDMSYVFDTFSIPLGPYHVDAAIVLYGTQVIPMKQALGLCVNVDVPVYCVEQGVSWWRTESSYDLDNTSEAWKAYGMGKAIPVVLSAFDKKNWFEKLRHSDATPATLDKFLSTCLVAAPAIDLQRLQSIAEKVQATGGRYKTPTYLWAARTNKTKNPQFVLDVVDSLYKEGENLQVKYLTQTSDLKLGVVAAKHKLFDGREYIDVKAAATQTMFYEEASKSHVYICYSHSESYNSSIVEAALLGCVVLCRDSSQFRDLYSDGLGDPIFWISDMESARNATRWVLRNYEQAYAMQAPLREKFIKQQEYRVGHAISQDMANYWYDKPGQLLPHSGLGAVVWACADAMEEEFTEDALLASVEAASNGFKFPQLRRYISRRMPSNWEIRHMLLSSGKYIDTCTKRKTIYRKVNQ